ncbi:hypothetical protein AR1Y2_1632 [Anaerostipes rhamnosivorans]|uniref:Uncharacterized protein n=1 Tax=Anaerostipes rhamnosivorans TaxID=1229621 RepID=A0A4P8IC89_9FIRM|nr:hypothetical protein AR1Y2_1632 [Anaerostipes rhamnosivorans]
MEIFEADMFCLSQKNKVNIPGGRKDEVPLLWKREFQSY